MKFLHTADWQIGMKAAHVGKAADKVRDARLETVRRIRDLADETSAEFVLVAGDVFEDHGVSRKLVGQVGELLATFDCPVFLIPGNHDPWTEGGVWDYARESWRKRIRLLTAPEPVPIPGGTLYPCPLTQRWSSEDPTEWIREESSGGIRIGMAHGSLQSPLWEGQENHPIAPDAAQRSGLDYLALGDWHSVKEIPGRGGQVRMAYSGTPEPTNFGETDSGYALLVEIDAPGGRPRLERRKVGGLEWCKLDQEMREAGDLGRLVNALKRRTNPSATLLRLQLSGVLFATETEILDGLQSALSERFLYAQVDDAGLIPAPSDDSWIHNLPEGIMRGAAERLKGSAQHGNPVARRALLELYRFANGGAA